MAADNFGDRMKSYELAETGRRFMPLLPICARIDGRSFSRFTHGMRRPYDIALSAAMIDTTKRLVGEFHARMGYTQSDEISLVWLQDEPDSEMPFGGKLFKLCSVLPSFAASIFMKLCQDHEYLCEFADKNPPHFDCRVFQLPSREEAANAFLWREQDATKNAISMAARSVYSHKDLHLKSGAEMQEMLFAKGINFNDYPAFFKRGTFVRRVMRERPFTEAELARIPEKHPPPADQLVTRSEVIALDMPKFSTVTNRVGVIFDGEDPRDAQKAEG